MVENDGKPVTDTDALWTAFLASPAQMTMHEMEEVSRMPFAVEGRRTVRAGLVILTKSGKELLNVMHGDAGMVEFFAELAECAKDRAARLHGVAEALDGAAIRAPYRPVRLRGASP